MAMLSDQPMRSSLQVAPLAIQKSRIDANEDATEPVGSTGRYEHSQMTPPTTPDGSQEDLDAPTSMGAPVFHNFLRAFYPFQPSYVMTDSTVTLPLNEGDVILVHSIHTNGWADGTQLTTGARGWLPTNYCESYDPEEMRNLLKALLNFWDLMRSTSLNDNEMFGNQEFMKGIIVGVRYLLVGLWLRSDLESVSLFFLTFFSRSEPTVYPGNLPSSKDMTDCDEAGNRCYLSSPHW